MQNPTDIYDFFGSRPPGNVKAILTAQFEKICQTFHKLISEIALSVQGLPNTNSQNGLLEQSVLLDNAFYRFNTWGHENGADSQVLDYKLRYSKDLRDLVMELLEAIESSLDTGFELLDEARLQLRSNKAGDDQGDHDEFLEYMTCIADQIKDHVYDLVRLEPSLKHPQSEDLGKPLQNTNNTIPATEEFDIEQAKRAFPYASSTLHVRLGRANQRRRIAHLVAQDQIKRDGKVGIATIVSGPSQETKKTHLQDVAQDAFNSQKPTFEPEHRVTLLSPNRGRITVVQQQKQQKQQKQQQPLPFIKEAVYPKLPLDLSPLAPGQTQLFTCDFCGYDLEAGGRISTEADWRQHILHDLEPYVCTFDDCCSGPVTYAQRDEWYWHELKAHRIPKTWACPACRAEFATKDEAANHITSAHGLDSGVSAYELRCIQRRLKKTSSSVPLGPQTCSLCGDKVDPGVCMEHVSHHLENYALLSLPQGESSEEDGDAFLSGLKKSPKSGLSRVRTFKSPALQKSKSDFYGLSKARKLF